jgi:hypothetical protein
MLYAEYAPEVNARNADLRPEQEVNNLLGFRSVFLFDETSTKIIKASGRSKGFKEFPVHCHEWFIDLDTKDIPERALCARLDTLEASYRMYRTPSKGYHFAVDIAPMFGMNVPYTIKKYTEKFFPEADVSVCRASSLIRLPGTPGKSGNKKVLINEKATGVELEFPLLTPEVTRFNIQELETEPELLKHLLTRLSCLVSEDIMPGNRHMTIWQLSRDFADLGISEECAVEILLLVNRSWVNPKLDEEVMSSARGGYR